MNGNSREWNHYQREWEAPTIEKLQAKFARLFELPLISPPDFPSCGSNARQIFDAAILHANSNQGFYHACEYAINIAVLYDFEQRSELALACNSPDPALRIFAENINKYTGNK